MKNKTKSTDQTNTSEHIAEDWFNEILAQISADNFMLKAEIAAIQRMNQNNMMIHGSESDRAKIARTTNTMYYLKNLLFDYFQLLNQSEFQPIHLALDLSDSKVLVWAEIEDENHQAEDNLFLTEAKVNAKYGEFGFFISSTIVERSDLTTIPPHYVKVK